MVFIAIAAVKAAKTARHEFNKDKKRKEMINPVDGSATLMNHRQDTQQQGSQHWWDGSNPNSSNVSTSSPQQQHQSQHILGAWSRDSTMQNRQAQLNDQRQNEHQRPISTPLLPNTSDQQQFNSIINSVTTSSPRPISAPNFPAYNQTSSHSSSSDLQSSRDIDRPPKSSQLQNQPIKIKSNTSSSSSSRTASKSSPPPSNTQSQTRSKSKQEQEKSQKQESKPPTDGSFDSALRSGTLLPSTPVPRVGEEQIQQPTMHHTKSSFSVIGDTHKRVVVEQQQKQPTLTTATSAFGVAGETRKRTGATNSASSSASTIPNGISAMPVKMGSKRTIAPIPKTNTDVNTTSEGNLASAFKNPGVMKKKTKKPPGNPPGSRALPQTEQNAQHKFSPTSVSTQSSMSAAGSMKKWRGAHPSN